MSELHPGGQAGEASFLAEERRAWVRYASGLSASCQPVGGRKDDQSWTGTVRDISVSGIGLVLRRRFERGAILSIELQGADDLPARLLLARVVHAQRRKDGGWVIGCQLATRISEEAIQALQ